MRFATHYNNCNSNSRGYRRTNASLLDLALPGEPEELLGPRIDTPVQPELTETRARTSTH